jgi:hypothetical protein
MEMPIDILTHRFGKIVDSGSFVSDYTALAIGIDEELQEKFISIPYEEIVAVEIEDTSKTNIHTSLQAGSGPETIRANPDDNPAWLYNSAVHALAMWQHLSRLQEHKAEEDKLAKRPEPGVYEAHLANEDDDYFTVVVDEKRRLWVPQSSGGMLDMSSMYDLALGQCNHWALQRIDTATGAISA